jgi:hypothetical protein
MIFGIMLFLVKSVRAANDNLAPMFYNSTKSLAGYFWVGLAISVFSFFCSFYLIEIHELVIEQAGNKSKEKL